VLTGMTKPSESETVRVDSEETRIRARVIWYYYIGGMTQQEIADRLGMTRLRVNKIVGQARTDGSVEIKVHTPLAECVALEERLRRRYGLVDATVIPTIPENSELQRVIGESAAAMLDSLLTDGQYVGIGWGRTLGEGLKKLPTRRFGQSWVVSLMGGLIRGSGTNTFEVATQLAQIIGAQCYYLPAPIYCPDEESRSAMLNHFGLSEVMTMARKVDVSILSCGDLSDRPNLASIESVRGFRDSLLEAGAVGEILGTFLDAEGRPVDHPLNQRVMAMAPEDLKSVEASIIASGGVHKAPILHAILAAGYCNRIVTDEDTARAMLDKPLPARP
jgi:DNA-binding transcriptional regulator LsrR (DeoR family)